MAGVPVKYGKCVPAKYSVQVPTITVSLHNRFQCLQDLCDSQNVVILDINHTHRNVHKQHTNSVSNAAHGKQSHANQHLEECKPPPSCSDEMLQPLLADQAKLSFQGNINQSISCPRA